MFLHISGMLFGGVCLNFLIFSSLRWSVSSLLLVLFLTEVGGAGGDEDRDEDNDVGELPDELMSDVRGGTGRLFLAFLSISSFISK